MARVSPARRGRSCGSTACRVMQLVEQNAGVALGPEPLFTARERAGSNLKRLFGLSQPTGGYWLVHRRGVPIIRRCACSSAG